MSDEYPTADTHQIQGRRGTELKVSFCAQRCSEEHSHKIACAEQESEILAARKSAALMQRGGIRPEVRCRLSSINSTYDFVGKFLVQFIILGIIFVVLPLFGYIFYRNILFQIDQFFGAFNSHPCTFSSRDPISGETSEWDLTALSRTLDQCPSGTKCRDYSVAREDEVFFMNVCRHTMQKPQPCRDLLGDNGVTPAMGYQTADGVCYRMGQLAGAQWGLLDRRHPEMGLKLTYTGGSQCDGDTDRSTEYRFECDADAGVRDGLEHAVLFFAKRTLRRALVGRWADPWLSSETANLWCGGARPSPALCSRCAPRRRSRPGKPARGQPMIG